MGIDPGLVRTGLGVIRVREGHYVYLGSQAISPPTNHSMASRLEKIFLETSQFIKLYKPSVMVVEELIYAHNPQIALKLGQVRGVLLLVAARSGLSVIGYKPKEVKQAVTGSGAASKQQVQRMVQNVLNLEEPPESYDVSDALALSICHAHRLA